MENKDQERIKTDAIAYVEATRGREGRVETYITGATAVHTRAQVLVDALEWIKTYGPVGALTVKFIDNAINQWKGKEVDKFTEEDAEYMRSCDIHPLLDGSAKVMTEDSEGVRLDRDELLKLAAVINKYVKHNPQQKSK